MGASALAHTHTHTLCVSVQRLVFFNCCVMLCKQTRTSVLLRPNLWLYCDAMSRIGCENIINIWKRTERRRQQQRLECNPGFPISMSFYIFFSSAVHNHIRSVRLIVSSDWYVCRGCKSIALCRHRAFSLSKESPIKVYQSERFMHIGNMLLVTIWVECDENDHIDLVERSLNDQREERNTDTHTHQTNAGSHLFFAFDFILFSSKIHLILRHVDFQKRFTSKDDERQEQKKTNSKEKLWLKMRTKNRDVSRDMITHTHTHSHRYT